MPNKDLEKMGSLPSLSLNTSLHLQTLDQKLPCFEESASFNPAAQERPPGPPPWTIGQDVHCRVKSRSETDDLGHL